MYEEIMTNDDNLEFNLLSSSLLEMLVQVLLQVEPEICVEEEVQDNWRATDIYMNSVKLIIQWE